jgi:hypothetical protein
MNKTKPDKLWIAHRPYDESRHVIAEYDPFCELWRVKQKKTGHAEYDEVILASHLCIREAKYHAGGKISGYIITFKQLRDLHYDLGHDDDDVFRYDCLEFDGERWVCDGVPILKSHFADCGAWEETKILAINTDEVIQ